MQKVGEGSQTEEKKKEPNSVPLYHKPCFLADMMFWPARKVLSLGNNPNLDFDDLYPLENEWTTDIVYPEYEKGFKKRISGTSVNFNHAFYRPFLWETIYASILQLISNAAGIMMPFAIKNLVDWLNSPDSSSPSTSGNGWLYAGILVVACFAKIWFKRRSIFVSDFTQHFITIAIRSLIFNKLARVSSEAIRNMDIGKMSNVVTADIMQIQMFLRFSAMLLVNPLIIIGISVYLIVTFNWISLIIPVVFLLLNVSQIFLNKMSTTIMRQKKELTDQRCKLISEVITGIKNVKYTAWEDQVLSRMNEIREKECTLLKKFLKIRLFLQNISEVGTPLSLLGFFFFYTMVNNATISLSEAYLIITLVAQIGYPLRMLTWSLDIVLNSRISLQRIGKVLLTPEHIKRTDKKNLPLGSINFKNYSGGWFSQEQCEYFGTNKDKLESLALSNITTDLKPGKIYGVIGAVGSGKSSFLLAIIDDLASKSGSIEKHGSVAFVSQNAFLLNATIKDNIVFHKEYDEERYKRSVVLACLLDDLKQLSGGDMTEIGERGINLSGGQKQRITIARALYADSDIVLFDDCLSALDAEVGRKVFYGAIKHHLKGKTVVLVTHQTSVLPDVDEILLIKNGQLVLQGPHKGINKDPIYLEYYQQVQEEERKRKQSMDSSFGQPSSPKLPDLQRNRSNSIAFPEEVKEALGHDEAEFIEEMKKLDDLIINMTEKQREENLKKGELLKAETRKKGIVSLKYLLTFSRSYGCWLMMLYILITSSFAGGRIFGDFWIGAWSKHTLGYSERDYAVGFLVFTVIMTIILVLMSIMHAEGMVNVCYRINNDLTKGILKNKIEFFDTTPIGVIINRFTKDVDILDSSMSSTTAQFIIMILQMTGILILMMITVPFMIILIIIAVLAVSKLATMLLKVNSDIKRLALVAGSPILSNISEGLNGSLILSTFGCWPRLVKQFVWNQDRMCKVEMHDKMGYLFTFFMVDIICSFLLTLLLLFIILIKIYNVNLFRDPNILALAVSWMAIVTDIIPILLWCYQDVNIGLNSIERISDMAIPVAEEESYDTPKPPSSDWPKSGNIELKNLCVRYREGLPLVLKNLTLQIDSCQKVGIVGRTGSGKSSLILALKRMINQVRPTDACESYIKVDGVDISQIGLKFYRPAVVLIPQDPFLLSGTVRSNIDSENKFSDQEIVEVLKKTQIYDNIYESMNRTTESKGEIKIPDLRPDTDDNFTERGLLKKEQTSIDAEILAFPIKDGGTNLSQGQRQLLCIARAIISRPKILLMDEATSNIDAKTDQIIQRIIKHEFSGSTVLTIAHRLNTIIQYDRVVVLTFGEITDQGTPSELLEREGTFRDLVKELGPENFEKMKKYAADKSLEPILD